MTDLEPQKICDADAKVWCKNNKFSCHKNWLKSTFFCSNYKDNACENLQATDMSGSMINQMINPANGYISYIIVIKIAI